MVAAAHDEETVVDAIERYLLHPAGRERSWVWNGEPLIQAVDIRVDAWRSQVQSADLAGSTRTGVNRALDLIDSNGQIANRELITRLSTAVEHSDVDRVACWFAAMCWGAGPRRRSRLRQWTRSLDTQLGSTLAASTFAVIQGDLENAYRSSRLPGVGEAYLTKWLWALGLPASRDLPTRPMVLDRRVRETLTALGWRASGPNAAQRWVDYCQALARWANLLNQNHVGWRTDPDRIEQVLFDRDSGQGACLLGYLRERD